MTRKSTAPDSLQLWVDTLRKVPSAFGDVSSKNVHARQLSALGQSFSKNFSSDLLRYPEKVQLQAAFGFWSISCKKPCQHSEICPEKTFTPGSLRLLVIPLQKASPATRCDDSKKCSSGQLPAFGRYSAKISASLRRCTPKKRSRQIAFGFWLIPCGKPLK